MFIRNKIIENLFLVLWYGRLRSTETAILRKGWLAHI